MGGKIISFPNSFTETGISKGSDQERFLYSHQKFHVSAKHIFQIQHTTIKVTDIYFKKYTHTLLTINKS